MAMGREGNRQDDLIMTWAEVPRSPGHVFYDRLQEVLIAGGFDLFVETACQPYYAPKMGAPSVPPGRYFRMHMVGYFEGIASERSIAWRCSDSMSLRDFLRLENRVSDLAEDAAMGRISGEGDKVRHYGDFLYAKSWKVERRVVARVEAGPQGADSRFIVTNLRGLPKALYEKVYCARGQAENLIKAHKLHLAPTLPRRKRRYSRT
jgi:hypothetical protein